MKTKIKQSLSDMLVKLKTVGLLLWSKGAAILILVLLMVKYMRMGSEDPSPFLELFYAAILIASIAVVAPIVRLVVFVEAAEIAESGAVRDLITGTKFTPQLVHYWFATLISCIIVLLCVSSLLSF